MSEEHVFFLVYVFDTFELAFFLYDLIEIFPPFVVLDVPFTVFNQMVIEVDSLLSSPIWYAEHVTN